MDILVKMLGTERLMKRQEFVRLIIQSLDSLGYKRSVNCLEEESGIPLNSVEFSKLELQIRDGKLDDCVVTLKKMEGLKDNTRELALFLIFKHRFLEHLIDGNVNMALYVLHKDVSELKVGKEKIHDLAYSIVSLRDAELGVIPDCTIDNLQRWLLKELKELLPPPITLPERRLEVLVEKVVMSQIDSCLYHNSMMHYSLFEDHCCGSDQIPMQTIQILTEHKNEIWFVQFSNNGNYLASSSSDCTAIIWEVLKDNELELKNTLQGHQKAVSFVAWSPDDTRLLTCGMLEVLKLWDVETGECKQTFGDPSFLFSSCSWFPDSNRFACGSCGSEKGIYIYDCDKGVNEWRGRPKVLDIAVTPDGRNLVSISADKEISILDLETNAERIIFEEHHITSLSISGNSMYLLVNLNNQEIHVWNMGVKHEKPLTYIGHKQQKYVIRSCFGGLDNNYFISSGSEDSQVYIWNMRNIKPVAVLSGHSMTVNCVSWNPKNLQMLASASDDRTIRIWGPRQV